MERTSGESIPPTSWTLVGEAGAASEDRRLAALERLLRLYYAGMLTYIQRQFRSNRIQAEDWLHDFILDKLVRKQILARADRNRGRFRNFLFQSLNRYILDQIRHSERSKRSPEHGIMSVEEVRSLETFRTEQSQSEFDLEFARQVLALAIDRMKARCEKTNRSALWKVFEERVIVKHLEGKTPTPYEKLLPALELDSAPRAANLLTTSRRMFVRVLRSVVADYCGGEEAVDREIKDLRAILSNTAD